MDGTILAVFPILFLLPRGRTRPENLRLGRKTRTMRQILIVHSSVDERFESFFSKIFMTVEVQAVWETYVGLTAGEAAKEKIRKAIQASDALFFILSRDGEFISRAKAWFPWATDLAGGKDIWVFEHCEDLKRVPVMIPTLGHYVAYYITNAWSDFVLAIAETYEKPKAVLTPLPEAVLKSLTSAEENASFDTLTGRALFDDSTSRPISLRTRCPYCSSAYNLYLPSDMKVIRCPSCNLFYGIQKPNNVSAPAVA